MLAEGDTVGRAGLMAQHVEKCRLRLKEVVARKDNLLWKELMMLKPVDHVPARGEHRFRHLLLIRIMMRVNT
jgi:hypothetical protein